jgi:hypothetical protein
MTTVSHSMKRFTGCSLAAALAFGPFAPDGSSQSPPTPADSIVTRHRITIPVAVQAYSAAAAPQLSVLVRPVRDGTEQVTAVAVREEVRGIMSGPTRSFSLRAGIVHTGRHGIADRVDSLVVRDAAGVVPLGVRDDPENESGYTYYRHWRAQRDVVSPVTVTYRMRPVPKPSPGPQFEFYAHGGGLNAAGMQLFVLPESLPSALVRVKWDLSDLAPGSTAVSTYGEGDFTLRGSPDTITKAFYLAGPLGHYDPPAAGSGFRAYWLGRPDFDPAREMEWLSETYAYLRRFYRDSTTRVYRVFIQASGRGGGTASQNSFMGSAAPGDEDSVRAAPRVTYAHEIGHYFLGSLSGGAEGSGPWYGEGLNTHYTRLLLLRSGLAPVSDYLNDVNASARGYYTSAYRNYTNDSLTKIGFSTGFGAGSAQNLAYTRGSLFWAALDARIRAASSGRRTLDDLMLPLIQGKRAGHPLTREVVEDAIAKELGPAGREFFEGVIIRGEPLVPPSDAFGPCFDRKAVTYTVGGQALDGYEWVRLAAAPDEQCRRW